MQCRAAKEAAKSLAEKRHGALLRELFLGWAKLAAIHKEHKSIVSRMTAKREKQQLCMAVRGWSDHVAVLKEGHQAAEKMAKR